MTPRISRLAGLASALLPATVVSAALCSAALPAGRATPPPAPEYGPSMVPSAAELAGTLTGLLGQRAAGAYLRDGRLVVNVVDDVAAGAVRAAGAESRLVARPLAALDTVFRDVDRLAARLAPVGTAWFVDVPGNALVVRVPAGAPGRVAFARALRRLAPAVRIEQVPGIVGPLRLDGGEAAVRPDARCSLGFNAVDPRGRSVFLTAGHCGVDYPSFGQEGAPLGRTLAYRFPGADYAAVALADPGYWQPAPAVDHYDGATVPVRGARPALVGAAVCKSGITSRWTCGTITAYDVSVRYPEGVVRGLVAATACAEPGDSGGPWLAGDQAQGLTSGGAWFAGRCLSRFGAGNEAYYQPIGPVLTALGLRLRTAP